MPIQSPWNSRIKSVNDLTRAGNRLPDGDLARETHPGGDPGKGSTLPGGGLVIEILQGVAQENETILPDGVPVKEVRPISGGDPQANWLTRCGLITIYKLSSLCLVEYPCFRSLEV